MPILYKEAEKVRLWGVVTSWLAVLALPSQTLPFDPYGPGGGGVCPSLTAKGRRSRLTTIN